MVRPLYLLGIFLAISLTPMSTCVELKELLSWKTLDYTFKSSIERKSLVDKGLFTPTNNIPNSIAVWRDKIFLAIPRARPGVPFTLCSITRPNVNVGQSSGPLLNPYPTAEMNEIWPDRTGHSQPSASQPHPIPTQRSEFNVAATHKTHEEQDHRDHKKPSHGSTYNGKPQHPNNEESLPQRAENPKRSVKIDREEIRKHQVQSALKLFSVYNIKVDSCNRLWVMDSGKVDGSEVALPQIFSIDLQTGAKKRYVFTPDLISEDSLFANIYVDIHKNNCENVTIYMPDLDKSLVVYDMLKGKAWRIKHWSFHMDRGGLLADDGKHHLDYGLYGMALSKSIDGQRDVYYHALASTSFYVVSSKTLQNSSEEIKSTENKYELVGTKDKKGRTGASIIHGNVMFYVQINKDEDVVDCWNVKKPFQQKRNHVTVVRPTSDIKLVYPADLTLDHQHHSTLYILSTEYPVFLKDAILDPNKVNFRVFVASTDKLISGSYCSSAGTPRVAFLAMVLGTIAVWLTK